eukprot:197377_1
MSSFVVCILLLSLISINYAWPWSDDSLRDANGGDNCVICTLITAIVAQTGQLYQIPPMKAFERFCSYFTQDILHDACDAARLLYGPSIAHYLDLGYNPDETCFALNWCNDKDGPMCRLFPPYNKNEIIKQEALNNDITSEPTICNITEFKPICDVIERWGDDHYPVDDIDGDRFSDKNTMRGTNWRGKDCDDISKDIYPGRISMESDRFIDSNCNGIKGVNNKSIPYEDIFCKSSQQFGIAVWGDSAGAHFHLPPEWMNVTEMNQNVFEQAYYVLLDELDWPMLSATSAFYNNTERWKYIIDGPVQSLYEYMYENNKCIHRDYQNLGVNGARSSSMAHELIQTIARNAKFDHPIWGLFELIGNDVCSGHPGTSHMTTPTQFYTNNMESFTYLDSVLPNGSRILTMGLANGTVLYDSMHDKIHPIGWLNQDVTYSALYDYLNCLLISPCYGWMNSNATMRQVTQQRADELSESLKNLTETETFENITLQYIDFPLGQVIDIWHSMGGETWQLIEPVDGFHPNQIANSLLAQVVWSNLKQNMSHWIPPENQFNDEITKIFGDQGGY